jgi:hypothetical protein
VWRVQGEVAVTDAAPDLNVDPASNGLAAKGRRFTQQEFVRILHDVAKEARRQGTAQGTLRWEFVGGDAPYLVEGVFGVAGHIGRGGVRTINRDMGGMGRVAPREG